MLGAPSRTCGTALHPRGMPRREVKSRERNSNMAVSRHTMAAGQQPVAKMGESAGLAELVGVILDKGIVIDAWVRVSVVGLEVLTVEARVVVSSVDTYLRYAEAIGRIGRTAPSPRPQSVSGGKNDQDHILESEVLRRLSEHLEG